MGQMEWAVWANEQTLASSYILIIGASVGLCGIFDKWGIAVFGLITGIGVLFIEFPRGLNKKGQTKKRRLQECIVLYVSATGPLARNYYVRFCVYMCLAMPCCFMLPTFLGGMCLFMGAFIYLMAAVNGESWKPGVEKKPETQLSQERTEKSPRLTHRFVDANDCQVSLSITEMRETVV
ncbi:cytochrome b-245 light chain-like isoform X1 [Limulus polyphemus]|uniref:Cytochrome b-245 light chain n=1 Tax=Limulus polyphemus TaxID=6850 RepID=A0ABM1BC80_LIMPO|nr:cytochrome b-245 light chain-like isoform X1 [Limulus polyphemus]